jgi:hypothetical protein
MKKKLLIKLMVAAIISFLPYTLLLSQYQIPYSVIGSGGGQTSNSNYISVGTSGEALIGKSVSTSNQQYAGFWYTYEEDIITSMDDDGAMPAFFKLEQNYPNPFNPSTIIRFGVPEKSNVTVKIYDILGSEVVTIVNEEMDAGWYERSFNADGLSSGVYIYRMEAVQDGGQSGNFVSIKKMLMIK